MPDLVDRPIGDGTVTSRSPITFPARGENSARCASKLPLDLFERRLILVVGDCIAAATAAASCVLAANPVKGTGWLTWFDSGLEQGAFMSVTWMAAAILLGSYALPHLHRTASSWGLLGMTGALGFAACTVVLAFSSSLTRAKTSVLVFSGSAFVLVAAWRRLWGWAGGHARFSRPVLIVGGVRAARTLTRLFAERPTVGYRVVGFVDYGRGDRRGLPATGGVTEFLSAPERPGTLAALAGRLGSPEVVLAVGDQSTSSLMNVALVCNERGLSVTSAADLYERMAGRFPAWQVGENWTAVLPLGRPAGRRLYLSAKRVLDIVGAAVGLGVLALLLPVVALAIRLDSAGPIIYRQVRTGQGARPYSIWKFRTMTIHAEQDGAVWSPPRDPRTTRVGRVLRMAHVDELPQFWNVLKGDMSLVGPRPERPEIDRELEGCTPFYRLRTTVKPGIAGWAAVNAPYVDEVAKAAERLEYDLYYIKHQSLWLDLQVIVKAIGHCFFFRGR